MILSFELSMPSSNSWNGKWTGDNKCYAKTRSGNTQKFKDKAKSLEGRHRYNFGDGWAACVEVKIVDSKEAASLRRRSGGFCGYDWMIDSLMRVGKIAALIKTV